jgi:type III secretion protein J
MTDADRSTSSEPRRVRPRRTGADAAAALIALVALAASGCTSRVALANLDASEAERCGVVLRAAGLDASVERDDAGGEGRHRVAVRGDEASYRSALQLLAEHGLPRRRIEGLETSASLIPSPTEERARYIRGLSDEIEGLLESVDGVVAADVLVSIPERRPLAQQSDERASASAVVAHAGDESPLSADEIRDVVVRAVGGTLARESVAVLLKPVVRPTSSVPVIRYERDRLTEAAFLATVCALVAVEAVTVWLLRAARRAAQATEKTDEDAN